MATKIPDKTRAKTKTSQLSPRLRDQVLFIRGTSCLLDFSIGGRSRNTCTHRRDNRERRSDASGSHSAPEISATSGFPVAAKSPQLNLIGRPDRSCSALQSEIDRAPRGFCSPSTTSILYFVSFHRHKTRGSQKPGGTDCTLSIVSSNVTGAFDTLVTEYYITG